MGRTHQRIVGRVLSAAALLGILCFVVAGCGSSGKATAVVDGTVLYKGKPVTGGMIMLEYDHGPKIPGQIDPETGSFRIINAPLGKATVTVNTATVKSQANAYPDPSKMKGAGKNVTLTEEQKAKMRELNKMAASANRGVYMSIPSRYVTKAQSPLHWDIKAGDNHEGNIELTLK